MPMAKAPGAVIQLTILPVTRMFRPGSIVPFRPARAERSSFRPASTLDVMEAHHDLRKFITELPVAQRCAVLSSGREVDCDERLRRVTVQYTAVPANGRTPGGRRTDRDIEMWDDSLQGRGSRSSTAMGSDQKAAEALQEAETEVGEAGMVDRGADAAVRGAGQTYRSAYRSIDFGLTA
jgi:hypothetical protein